MTAFSFENDRWIFHRQPAADVAIDPFDFGVLVGDAALGHQIVDIRAPILHRAVADVRAGECNELDDSGVE